MTGSIYRISRMIYWRRKPIVWCELMTLVAAGVRSGLALGYGAAVAIAHVLGERGGFRMPVEYSVADPGVLAALFAAAAVMAAIPALLAYRLPPAEALRG
ncbi:hypothetical protein [Ancylobacter terrae]|uniref:hypothetical protein n=1 Tax=Ancylobacter sp. sgz301288 TaxID=3342077 RepID=UPI00385A4CFF